MRNHHGAGRNADNSGRNVMVKGAAKTANRDAVSLHWPRGLQWVDWGAGVVPDYRVHQHARAPTASIFSIWIVANLLSPDHYSTAS